MSTLYLSTAYLAPIFYYKAICRYDHTVIEAHSHYIKQSYRNRCIIMSAGGPLSLTIPVERTLPGKPFTKDMRISKHNHWQHIHWNAITSAYSSSPFFEYFRDDFYPFYQKPQAGRFLLDYNQDLQEMILRLLNISPSITYSDSFLSPTDDAVDLREAISPKHKPIKELLPRPYYQVFSMKWGFLPTLSIIDLLFNMGNESLLVLRD
ncbi:MAG: WbqC family protein [Porphyromonadaceae bacterium]|nr:WbqC family protein [Porphyromonadaceae bacterium]